MRARVGLFQSPLCRTVPLLAGVLERGGEPPRLQQAAGVERCHGAFRLLGAISSLQNMAGGAVKTTVTEGGEVGKGNQRCSTHRLERGVRK